ncbi:hypothetical protein S40293_05698 [Stachybotrys chartarum IBT 40293]|nr:hypothetical protein S40293_05698 [Stachybotrys chartarum IBT 40293]
MTAAYPETHLAIASTAKRAPLTTISVPTVAPGPGEVVVRVQWAASTPLDLHQADGGVAVQSYPFVMGCNLAGVVVAVGPDDASADKPHAAPLVVGDRVVGFAALEEKSRGYQEYVTMPRCQLGRVPDNITTEAAVTVPTNLLTTFHAMTAEFGLDVPWPTPQGYVPRHADAPFLIWGGASSVGLYMVQMLRHWGYKNVLVVASRKHHAELTALGATKCFDYHDADVAEQIRAHASKIPFILDCIGSMENSMRPLTKIAESGSVVAVLMPVIIRDATAEVEPQYTLLATDVLQGEWKDGVEVRSVRAFFYDQNPLWKTHLQPDIMPALLETGVVQPNRQRIVEGASMLERAQKALDLMRERAPSGESCINSIMAATDDSIELAAHCLCKKHEFTTPVKKQCLPLKAFTCHCHSCRHLTGSLFTSDTPWPGPHKPIRDSSLSKYAFTKNVTLLFCGTCSAPLFFHEHYEGREDEIGVFTGALANAAVPELVRFVDHIFMGDVPDGGAAPWLGRVSEGGAATMWHGRRHKTQRMGCDWPAVELLPTVEEKSGVDEIGITCRCKGVDLRLRRGEEDYAHLPAEELPPYIDPETRKRLVTFECCDSCRLTLGADIINWTSSSLRHIAFPTSALTALSFPSTTAALHAAVTSTIARDARLGTLAAYASSPGVRRYFCARCSASIFYTNDKYPDDVDIPVGVLEHPGGAARAEDFLVWEFGTMGYVEDGKGGWREGFVEGVRRDAEEWRVKRGYPNSARRMVEDDEQSSA